MKPLKIFLTHGPHALAHYYGPRALAGLQALGEIRRNHTDEVLSVDEMVKLAGDCDIIVSYRVQPGSAELLQRLPHLLAFCRCAVDIRNVDIAAASAKGILVTQASAGFKTSVAEWIVGAMIDLGRHITYAAKVYHAGKVPEAKMGRELKGSTLGIIGYGQIARTLTPIAHALGMSVLIHDPYATITSDDGVSTSFTSLLAQSDFVVPLAVATQETENLIGAAAFAAMKPSAYFINASRGNLVDEVALLDALNRGSIAGCALDVGRATDQMPTPELAAHPLVIATPHVAGLTLPAIEHQSMETVHQVSEILQGRLPLGAVNAEAAARLRDWFRP
jgi:D-3-phosphoglycerate dehydrogenase